MSGVMKRRTCSRPGCRWQRPSSSFSAASCTMGWRQSVSWPPTPPGRAGSRRSGKPTRAKTDGQHGHQCPDHPAMVPGGREREEGLAVMKVGIPKEVKNHEYRVAITPSGVHELVRSGHQVFIEHDAGSGSAIPDGDFTAAGAAIVGDADAVWAAGELILKVKEPVAEEYHRMRKGQVLFTYLHLAASRPCTDALLASGITAIAYETVQAADGKLPLLAPMSEVAGRMAPQVGARLLEKGHGGRGVLLGGVSGVQPARVVVLGAGIAGANAAWIAQGMEAEVVVLDRNLDRLRYIDSIHQGRILTLMSNRTTVEEAVASADLVIGAVLVPGALAPHLVTERMVEGMKQGSVVIDI